MSPTGFQRRALRVWAVLPYPFLVMFGLGVFWAGLPLLLPASPSVQVLPDGVLQIFESFYAFGGVATAVGVVTRRPGIEALGLGFMGGPFAVQGFLTIQLLGASGLRSGGFLFFVAVGCLLRLAMIVARVGGRDD